MAEYTAKGTLKRDPSAPKTEAASTPEEKAARIAAARERALAAKAAGGTPSAHPAAASAAPADVAAEAPADDFVAAAPPSDGLLRTAKGTIKRDPNAPKTEAPATPEERARRLAEAKAKAEAARKAREAGGGSGALQPGAAAAALGNRAAGAAAAAGAASAEAAERKRIFDIVTRPVPGAEPILRPTIGGRAERAPARAEFPMNEQMEDTVNILKRAVPGMEIEVLSSPLDPVLVVDREDVPRLLAAARDHEQLDMKLLRCINGVDQMDEGIEIVYVLKSLTTQRSAIIKTLLPLRDPVVESAVALWPAAEWHERETREMFGVTFRNHPDPRNLLLDEDMAIHPLLKAHPLQELELKQGVSVF